MARDFGRSLRVRLTNTAAVTNIVSSSKISPIVLPQGVDLPGITYQKISDVPIHAMGNDIDLRAPLYQVSCWSTSYSQALSIAKAVKGVMQDFTGTLATSGVDIQRAFLEGEVEMVDYDDVIKRTSYHIAQTYRLWGTT